MAQAYFITGQPEINPFQNVVTDNPMHQNFLRQYHQLPTYGYAVARKKFQDFNTLYWENPNNVARPVKSFESIKIRQPKTKKTLMQDISLPFGVSEQLPVEIKSNKNLTVDSNIQKKYKQITNQRVHPYARVPI